MGSIEYSLAAKPGGDLLFHRLSDSTIGAVRFHGRVRDGIGWVTDAKTTKLWGQRVFGFEINAYTLFKAYLAERSNLNSTKTVIDGEILKREKSN